MAASVATGFQIFVNGADLAGFFKTVAPSYTVAELDSTCLNTSGNASYLPGVKDSALSVEGIADYADADNDGFNDILTAARSSGADVVVSIAYATVTAGGLAVMAGGPLTSYELISPLNQLNMASFGIKGNNAVGEGKWITAKMEASSGTNNSASLDNGAATSNGGIFHAHLFLEPASTATSGGTSIKLQHSTNNSTWADLVASQVFAGTFSAVRSQVAAGTTVNRYLRFQVVTDGEARIVACFSRRA